MPYTMYIFDTSIRNKQKKTRKVMKTIKELAIEYLRDPNCRPELWAKDAVQDGDITVSQIPDFVSLVKSIQKDEQDLSNGFSYLEKLHP